MAQYQYLMAIGRDSGRSTLSHSCEFACQQRVLKIFPGHDYLRSEDGVVWLWHFLVNLHIYDSPFYFATSQSQCLMAIGRDSGSNIMCHSRGFALLPGRGYLCYKDRVVWLRHFMINLEFAYIYIYIYLYKYIDIYINI